MRRFALFAALAIPAWASAGEDATSEYARIRASTPRTADAQAKLALWCEAHGLDAEKGRHLALALALEPKHALARGLMGLVEYRGRWLTPEGVAQSEREDAASAELRAEYVRRRDGAAMTAEGQWKLSEWCRAKGLDAEARAHAENVVRWEPGRDEAWQRLGYRKKDGRWMKPEEIERGRMELEAQQKADRQWAPKLKAWRDKLKSSSRAGAADRERIEREMEEIRDPRAVRAIWFVFAKGGGSAERTAARLFGQIDSGSATQALAMMAVFGGDEEARRLAGEHLRNKDPREYVPLLIGLVRKPYKYELKPISGPGGQGKLVVEGEKSNLERTYSAPLPQVPNGLLGTDPTTGVPAILLATPGLTPGLPVPALGASAWQTRLSDVDGRLADVLPRLEQEPKVKYGRLPQGNPIWDAIVAEMYRHQPMVSPGVGYAYAFTPQGFESIRDADLLLDAVSRWPYANPNTSVSIRKQPLYSTFASYPLADILAEARRSAIAAGQQQMQDVQLIEAINSDIRALNDRLLLVLKGVTQVDLGDDREAWRGWWADAYLGYRYDQKSQPNPTYYENVTPYQPRVIPRMTNQYMGYTKEVHLMSCFAAGTRVETLEGPRAIEGIKVGDRVLSQDVGTGALSYQPVVTTFHNPPQEVYRLKLGEGEGAEEILPTQYHRFWASGRGWVMARELKEGDAIRTLQGVRKVTAIGKGEVQPVFNLEVAETSSYFVGACGALAHDNMLPKPVEHPFDAE